MVPRALLSTVLCAYLSPQLVLPYLLEKFSLIQLESYIDKILFSTVSVLPGLLSIFLIC